MVSDKIDGEVTFCITVLSRRLGHSDGPTDPGGANQEQDECSSHPLHQDHSGQWRDPEAGQQHRAGGLGWILYDPDKQDFR